jgi:bacterioferritin-associated ferredoxin
MMVCLCHPFSDKKVREHLEKQGGSARVSTVYTACSDGEKPSCCTCLATLKDMVQTHKAGGATA